MRPYTNRLIHESSPYLLQHAHNPVDWYPWGEEAFEKAKNEDKPVLVSIGYAACHWCHVMERESFEDPGVAAIMNEKFVNIKVDREERPDVDHIYMDAVQAISGSGGWPLNVFLTPDKKPFFGGTYFPPVKAFNRSSWTDVLMSIDKSYRERKSEIERQAENLTAHLKSSNAFGPMPVEKNTFHISQIDQAFRTVMDTADLRWGGFGRAPKFPQTFTIHFLLQYADVRKNTEALNQVVLSLDKMLQGGIYDQIGGGFARYSTDAEWLAPHFEKMLYDNALLIGVLAESFQFTGRDIYKKAMEESLAFIERELMHEGGGFYSALDADSEGKEGKFYVWTVDEIKEILQDDAVVVCDYFDIGAEGNWEGENIPRIQKPLPAFASERKMDLAEAEKLIEKAKQKLLQKRSERIHPQLDDKIILGWNALMNIAYSKAYAATANEHYREVAVRNMQFLLNNFKTESDLLLHVWKNDRAKHPAFLDDYSYLIAALIELTQITADYQYLEAASKLTQTVIDHFSDEHDSFFFFTHREQKDILVRKKETYDGATPSGNSMMAYNLYRLSILLDKQEWRERSELMVSSLAELIIKYPTSFGLWLALLFEIISGTSEIAVVGKKWKIYLEKVHGIYISHKLALASENPLPRYPLLADKNETSEILIYLCKNYACRQPVNTIQEFVSLLESK